MGKYKYLAGNIALFSISNFVSKILIFLLVPFYTNTLSTHDYGIGDVMQTTLLLLVPALSINMGEAALRFGIEKTEQRSAILHIGLKYVGRASVLVAIICAVVGILLSGDVRSYVWMFIPLFITNSLYEYLILFFQGCEKVKIIVVGSVFSTIVLISSNLIFLLVLKIGLYGYLLSMILAFLLSSLMMICLGLKFAPECVGKFWTVRKSQSVGDEEKSLEKELLDYGRPMILYSTGSFINNAADRYFVASMCSLAVDGVYGVAYKIPSILSVFQRIFAQAWQLSATKSYTEKEGSEFYSSMYRVYHAFMVLGCSFLIFVVKIVATFLFRKDFYSAWQYVPPLLISVVFGAMTGFLGSICLAYKDSKAMGFATGIGAAVNIVLNFLLIPVLSAMGAAIATAISYYVMYVLAFIKVRKYVPLKVSLVRDYIAYAIMIAEALVLIYCEPYSYIINGCLFAVLLLLHYKEAVMIVRKLLCR